MAPYTPWLLENKKHLLSKKHLIVLKSSCKTDSRANKLGTRVSVLFLVLDNQNLSGKYLVDDFS